MNDEDLETEKIISDFRNDLENIEPVYKNGKIKKVIEEVMPLLQTGKTGKNKQQPDKWKNGKHIHLFGVRNVRESDTLCYFFH